MSVNKKKMELSYGAADNSKKCWKLYDTLIILNLIDIYKGFRLFIDN